MQENNSKNGISVGAVIGIIVGVVLLLGLVFTLIFVMYKNSVDRKISEIKNDTEWENSSEETMQTDDEDEYGAIDEEERESGDETGNLTEKQSGSQSGKGSSTVGTGDVFDMTISIDGQTLTLPFAYSEVKDKFKVDLSPYGFDDGYILNPGDSIASTIDVQHDFDDRFELQFGFANNSDSSKDILECDVSSLYADIEGMENTNYPNITLSGGITWGSTLDEVEAVYGKPKEDDIYRADELYYWSYTYTSEDYSTQVILHIYDDGGVKEIDLRTYQ